MTNPLQPGAPAAATSSTAAPTSSSAGAPHTAPPNPPFSVCGVPVDGLWRHLRMETSPPEMPLTADVAWRQTEREKLYNFLLFVPVQLELLVGFGFVMLLDSFLATLTLLPLRAVMATLHMLTWPLKVWIWNRKTNRINTNLNTMRSFKADGTFASGSLVAHGTEDESFPIGSIHHLTGSKQQGEQQGALLCPASVSAYAPSVLLYNTLPYGAPSRPHGDLTLPQTYDTHATSPCLRPCGTHSAGNCFVLDPGFKYPSSALRSVLSGIISRRTPWDVVSSFADGQHRKPLLQQPQQQEKKNQERGDVDIGSIRRRPLPVNLFGSFMKSQSQSERRGWEGASVEHDCGRGSAAGAGGEGRHTFQPRRRSLLSYLSLPMASRVGGGATGMDLLLLHGERKEEETKLGENKKSADMAPAAASASASSVEPSASSSSSSRPCIFSSLLFPAMPAGVAASLSFTAAVARRLRILRSPPSRPESPDHPVTRSTGSPLRLTGSARSEGREVVRGKGCGSGGGRPATSSLPLSLAMANDENEGYIYAGGRGGDNHRIGFSSTEEPANLSPVLNSLRLSNFAVVSSQDALAAHQGQLTPPAPNCVCTNSLPRKKRKRMMGRSSWKLLCCFWFSALRLLARTMRVCRFLLGVPFRPFRWLVRLFLGIFRVLLLLPRWMMRSDEGSFGDRRLRVMSLRQMPMLLGNRSQCKGRRIISEETEEKVERRKRDGKGQGQRGTDKSQSFPGLGQWMEQSESESESGSEVEFHPPTTESNSISNNSSNKPCSSSTTTTKTTTTTTTQPPQSEWRHEEDDLEVPGEWQECGGIRRRKHRSGAGGAASGSGAFRRKTPTTPLSLARSISSNSSSNKAEASFEEASSAEGSRQRRAGDPSPSGLEQQPREQQQRQQQQPHKEERGRSPPLVPRMLCRQGSAPAPFLCTPPGVDMSARPHFLYSLHSVGNREAPRVVSASAGGSLGWTASSRVRGGRSVTEGGDGGRALLLSRMSRAAAAADKISVTGGECSSMSSVRRRGDEGGRGGAEGGGNSVGGGAKASRNKKKKSHSPPRPLSTMALEVGQSQNSGILRPVAIALPSPYSLSTLSEPSLSPTAAGKDTRGPTLSAATAPPAALSRTSYLSKLMQTFPSEREPPMAVGAADVERGANPFKPAGRRLSPGDNSSSNADSTTVTSNNIVIISNSNSASDVFVSAMPTNGEPPLPFSSLNGTQGQEALPSFCDATVTDRLRHSPTTAKFTDNPNAVVVPCSPNGFAGGHATAVSASGGASSFSSSSLERRDAPTIGASVISSLSQTNLALGAAGASEDFNAVARHFSSDDLALLSGGGASPRLHLLAWTPMRSHSSDGGLGDAGKRLGCPLSVGDDLASFPGAAGALEEVAGEESVTDSFYASPCGKGFFLHEATASSASLLLDGIQEVRSPRLPSYSFASTSIPTEYCRNVGLESSSFLDALSSPLPVPAFVNSVEGGMTMTDMETPVGAGTISPDYDASPPSRVHTPQPHARRFPTPAGSGRGLIWEEDQNPTRESRTAASQAASQATVQSLHLTPQPQASTELPVAAAAAAVYPSESFAYAATPPAAVVPHHAAFASPTSHRGAPPLPTAAPRLFPLPPPGPTPPPKPEFLTGMQLYDILCLSVLLAAAAALRCVRPGTIYYWMKDVTSEVLKMSILSTALDFSDKILVNLGLTAQNALAGSCVKWRAGRTPLTYLLSDALVSLALTSAHGLVLMCQALVFSVALNSGRSFLTALLIADNFAELKSTVFKKWDVQRIWTLVCADMVERFHLLAVLAFVLSEEMVSEDSWAPPVEMARICAIIFAAEVAIDVVKHATLGKWNEVRPGIYREYHQELCEKALRSRSDATAHLLKFVPLAPAALCLRIAEALFWIQTDDSPSRRRPIALRSRCLAAAGIWVALLLAKCLLGYFVKILAAAFVGYYRRRFQLRTAAAGTVARAAVETAGGSAAANFPNALAGGGAGGEPTDRS